MTTFILVLDFISASILITISVVIAIELCKSKIRDIKYKKSLKGKK